MLKEKLFKFLFPKKVKIIEELSYSIIELDADLEANKKFAFEFDFTEVDDFGKPPHYLEGLNDIERKNYIVDLESIYCNKTFMEVLNYCINLVGNKTLQVLDEKDMFKGRYMILGLKKLLEEFEEAHKEFENSKKGEEPFDRLGILPE